MKRSVFAVPFVLAGICAVLLPVAAHSEVNVNVNIGPPAIVVAEPPEMVVIPRTMVYFAPGVSVDLFFCQGWWWTQNDGRWFRSRAYRGPWAAIGPRYVPVEVVRVPRDYRVAYGHEHHIPYGQLKKHYHDRDYDRRSHRGDWKEEKRERKAEKKMEKHEKKEHGRDSRGGHDDRGGRDDDRGGRGH